MRETDEQLFGCCTSQGFKESSWGDREARRACNKLAHSHERDEETAMRIAEGGFNIGKRIQNIFGDIGVTSDGGVCTNSISENYPNFLHLSTT